MRNQKKRLIQSANKVFQKLVRKNWKKLLFRIYRIYEVVAVIELHGDAMHFLCLF